MRKFLLACLLFLSSISRVYAVSVTLSNVPSTIDDQEFTLTVSIDGAGAGTNYLRLDLYQDGTSNYFGETDNGSYWYAGSDGKQYAPITIASSSAVTTIKARIGEPTLGAYPGPGNYKLKVRRYTNSGNQASNDVQTPINIALTKTWPSPSPTITPTPSPSPTPTSTPSPTPKPSPSSKPSPTPTPSPSEEGVVAGESTEIDLSGFGVPASPKPSGEGGSPAPTPKLSLNRERAKVVLLIGLGLMTLSVAGYVAYQKYLTHKKLSDV